MNKYMNIHQMLDLQDEAREALGANFAKAHDENHEAPEGDDFETEDEDE